MGSGWRIALAAIVVIALLIRVALVLATDGYRPTYDAQAYAMHALALEAKGSYPSSILSAPGSPTAFRPPAYPYLLAGVWKVSGVSLGSARLAGAVLGALTVLLLALVAGAVWDRRVALWAGAIAAVAPPLVLMSSPLLAENLFTPVVLGGVLACLRFARSGRLGWAAVAGLLCGLAALTRSNGVFLVLPAALAVWGSRRSGPRSGLVPVAVLMGCLVLSVAPWAARNAAAFGHPTPLTTQAGFSLAGIFNSTAAADGPPQAAPRTVQTLPEYRHLLYRSDLDEAEIESRVRGPALRFAAEHPLYVLEALRLNLLRTLESGGDSSFNVPWNSERDAVGGREALYRLGFWALLIAALTTIVLRRPRRRLAEAPRWLWLMPTVLMLTTLVFVGNPRYRLAVDGFLVLVAAVGAAELLRPRAGSERFPPPGLRRPAAASASSPNGRRAR
jgi:hypothetical protein